MSLVFGSRERVRFMGCRENQNTISQREATIHIPVPADREKKKL
jgi:hypothetical protein